AALPSILTHNGPNPGTPFLTNPLSASTLSANPQSRYQPTDVLANQSEATYKFDTSGCRHTALAGVEISKETSSIDKYAGLSSEALPGGFSGSGSLTGVSVFNPQYTSVPFSTTPTLTGLPRKMGTDTKSAYRLDSANYRDLVILNGGIRFDDYNINTSGYGTVNGVANVFGTQHAEFGLPNFNLGL